MTSEQAFLRARRPEHKLRRREAILAAALELAGQEGVQGVTLGVVAAAVGLAKSNVLRYFGTKEEIYLALAAQQWQEWAGDVAERLAVASAGQGPGGQEPDGQERGSQAPAGPGPGGQEPDDQERGSQWPGGQGRARQVARPGAARTAGTGALAAALTASLTERPVFCDLQSVLATTLERHAGLAAVREYKRAAVGALTGTGARIAAGWGLSEQEGFEVAAAAATFAGMLWPVTHPPEVLRTLYAEEPELAIACPPFAPTLNRLIRALAEGLPAVRTS